MAPEIDGLLERLDRAHAALIAHAESRGTRYSWDDEPDHADGIVNLVIGAIPPEDFQRAKALIPELEDEHQEQERIAAEARFAAEKLRVKPRKQSPQEQRMRVVLWHLLTGGGPLRLFQGVTVNDSLWGRVWAKVHVPHIDAIMMGAPISAEQLRASCWLWDGAKSKKRRSLRGVIQLAGRGSKVVIVCRLICDWFHGPPPTDKHEAGHTCPGGEQALCCNPWHLEWQTREENEQHKRRPVRAEAEAPFKGHAPNCPAYGNYQPPYEECTCGATS